MWSGVWVLEVRDLAFGGLHCGGSGDSVGSRLLFNFEIFTLLIFMFCEYTNVCFGTTFFFVFYFCFEKFHMLTKWIFF